MIKRLFQIMFICLLIVFNIITASASDSAMETVVESFVSVDDWKASGADRISLNEDADYCHDGETSLSFRYPQSTAGGDYSIMYAEWKNGGFPIPDVPNYMATKIGIWVYGCDDSNITMSLRTKSSASASFTESSKTVLDFEGWKFLEFEVPADTKFIYSVRISRIERLENPTDKYIYIDEITVFQELDISEKTDLTVVPSVADGETGISLTPVISYTFSNSMKFSENPDELPLNISVQPEAEFTVEKTDLKTVTLKFLQPLKGAEQYTVTFDDVYDIYCQNISCSFTFTTTDFYMELTEIKNNGNTIETLDECNAGSLELQISVGTDREELYGKEIWLFVSAFANDGTMLDAYAENTAVSAETAEKNIELQLDEKAVKVSAFFLDSLSERNVLKAITAGGERDV